MQGWYLDEPSKTLTAQNLLDLVGLRVYHASSKEDGEAHLEALKDEMGWHKTRTQRVDPSDVHYDEIVHYMATEHRHDEDEVRYMENGWLYLDARDGQDRWVRVQVGPGDHLVLAPGTYHRFITRDPHITDAETSTPESFELNAADANRWYRREIAACGTLIHNPTFQEAATMILVVPDDYVYKAYFKGE